jgi:hypothetical protein
METKRPNFFIVGAAKAGTTSVYQYLSQHLDVYMSPIKEPNYFSTEINFAEIRPDVQERIKLLKIDSYLKGDMKRTIHRAFIKDQHQYESLFRFATNQKAIGEASASYLYSPVAANNIRKYNPDAKIIIILRNPVQRIYSHYLMDRRMAVTQLSFEEALQEDKMNPRKMWGSKSLYHELGEYYEQVKRFYDAFPPNNILVILSEELRADALAVMQKIYQFLQVDATFRPDLNQEFNTGVAPRNPIISKLISFNYLRVKIRQTISSKAVKKFIRNLLFKKPNNEPISEETQRRLTEYYSEDIKKLSKLINKDLSKWQKIN